MESSNGNPKASKTKVSTAEAFYLVFCALPKKDRFTVARYILKNEEIRKSIAHREVPNDITLKALDENIAKMPRFGTIEELRDDLLS